MRSFVAVASGIPLLGPHGVAHVLIYPCGKACKNPPFPSRFIVSDRSSPSRVRFAASRPGRLRADPKDALLTRGKGEAPPLGLVGGAWENTPPKGTLYEMSSIVLFLSTTPGLGGSSLR